MGSDECYCEMCDQLKWIRITCECGKCICEDCRENMIDEMCEECYYDLENKIEKIPQTGSGQ
jgi:hypothetical protein